MIRRERKVRAIAMAAQIRSPQDSAPTPVNTRRQAKKYQPGKGLVFLIGGAAGIEPPIFKKFLYLNQGLLKR